MRRSGIMMDTPVGLITVVEDGRGICDVCFGTPKELEQRRKKKRGRKEELLPVKLCGPGEETLLLAEARRQLMEYFSGGSREFSLPLSLSGTDFQMEVWKALQRIPYGETRSYKQVAEMTGNPKACRAVGMANNRNPVAIIIPCHRVIGSDGSMVGYGGGMEHKVWLLDLEKRNSSDPPELLRKNTQ